MPTSHVCLKQLKAAEGGEGQVWLHSHKNLGESHSLKSQQHSFISTMISSPDNATIFTDFRELYIYPKWSLT